MPRKVKGPDGVVHTFPDDATDAEISEALETVAQRVRGKYPGAYDDLTDQELEAGVRRRFPGIYDDLPSTPTQGGTQRGGQMREYTIRDPRSGRTVTVRGDSMPSESELEQIFASVDYDAIARQHGGRPAPVDDAAAKGQTGRYRLSDISGAGKPLHVVSSEPLKAEDGRSGRLLSETEFNAIRDRLMSRAPRGLSKQDLERWMGPRLAAAVGEAENLPAPPEGSAVGRFLSNAGEMLNPVALARGVKDMVAHPIDTASNVFNAQVAQGREAVDLARQGRYWESGGHALASVLPIVGPAAAEAGGQIASGDVAGGLGKGAGLLIPTAGPSAIRAGRRALNTALPGGVRSAAAGALERSAAGKIADVMAPKVGANKTRFGGMAEDVAPALAKDGDLGAYSREGLHRRVQAKLDAAETALDDAQDARLSARTFNTKPIVDALLKKREQWTAQSVKASGVKPSTLAPLEETTKAGVSGRELAQVPHTRATAATGDYGADVVPAPNRARVAQIDQAIQEIKALGPAARYESIRRIRQAYDGPARARYSPSMTADYMKVQGEAAGAADVTGALREHLAKMDPRTAEANAQYSLFRKANDVLEATAEVERTRPKVGRRIIARLTGATVGGQAAGVAGAAAGYVFGPVVDAAMDAGWTTQIKTAQLMSKLASAVRRGSEGEVTAYTTQLQRLGKRLGVQGATLAGRTPSAPVGSEVTLTIR